MNATPNLPGLPMEAPTREWPYAAAFTTPASRDGPLPAAEPGQTHRASGIQADLDPQIRRLAGVFKPHRDRKSGV